MTVTGAIFGDILMTQRLADYIYLGPYLSLGGGSGLDEGIRRVARILRALEISTKSLKDCYLELSPETKQPGLLDALIPPHFQDFTIGRKVYQLGYTKRMAPDHPDKAVFVASMKPQGQAAEPDLVVVKFAYSYCKAVATSGCIYVFDPQNRETTAHAMMQHARCGGTRGARNNSRA